MKKPTRFVLAALLFQFLCAAALAQSVTDPTVYVTRTGKKYHKEGCQYLRLSSIPMKLSEATQKYTACSKCSPPVSGIRFAPAQTVKPESKQYQAKPRVSEMKQCAATTKSGTRCKRNAMTGSEYCWQHQR